MREPRSFEERHAHATFLRQRLPDLHWRMRNHVAADDTLPLGSYVERDPIVYGESLHFAVWCPDPIEDAEEPRPLVVWWISVGPYHGEGELMATYCRHGGLPSFLAALHDARIAAVGHDVSTHNNRARGEVAVSCSP
jgi:hypothetical protein